MVSTRLDETKHHPVMSYEGGRPPSVGPVAVLGPPPSSSGVPRTSSPSESSQKDPMESVHNASYPGGVSHVKSSYNVTPPSHYADRPPPSMHLFRPVPPPPPWMMLPSVRRFPPPAPRPPYYREPPFPPDQGRPVWERPRPLVSGADIPRPPSSGPERPRPLSTGPEMPRPPSTGPERGGFQPIPGRPGPPMVL